MKTKLELSESEQIYTGNLDKIQVTNVPGRGFAVTPILMFKVGKESLGADSEFDSGEDILEDVYMDLKDKIKVPFIVTTQLVDLYVITPE